MSESPQASTPSMDYSPPADFVDAVLSPNAVETDYDWFPGVEALLREKTAEQALQM
jgi:hypothetical protein